MKIDKSTESGIVILKPKGRIDGRNVSEFSSCMKQCLQEGNGKLIVDFSMTDYMSSSCLRFIIETQKQAVELGGMLVFCSPSEKVVDLFRVVHLEKSFMIYESASDALAALV